VQPTPGEADINTKPKVPKGTGSPPITATSPIPADTISPCTRSEASSASISSSS